MDKPKVSVVIIASLAGLLFGFDTAVIAGVTHALREVYELSPAALGATVSAALWGTLLGALVAGKPGDRFGTRDCLRFVGALYVVSALGCALSWDLGTFVAFRFLTGIAIGASSVLAPVYISEIVPAARRGALVGLFQFNIVLGILVAYLSNFAVGQWVGGADEWRWKLAVPAVPALVFFGLLFTIPQSPRWLAVRGRVAEAVESLRRLGMGAPYAVVEARTGGAASVDRAGVTESRVGGASLEQGVARAARVGGALLEEGVARAARVGEASLEEGSGGIARKTGPSEARENVVLHFHVPPEPSSSEASLVGERRERSAVGALSWREHRRPILLAVGVAMFNQLSGINAILYYLGDIFSAAGFSALSADLQSVAIGATNLVATVVAMSLIDRVGRKTLLLVGAVGMAVALCGVALIMASGEGEAWLLWMLVVFIASFAVSQGAVIWVYLSEVFPTAVRARGQGLGSATHWVMNAVISAVFPAVAAVSKPAPFAFFALMMALQFVVVWRFFPETKGVALEDMEAALAPGRARA